MSRPIKFRLYHPSRGMSGEYSLKSISHVIEAWVEGGIKDVNEIVELESTGLHDKNGKPIFEGDILRHRDGRITRLGVVEWSDFHARYYSTTPKGYAEAHNVPEGYHAEDLSGLIQEEIEVIGNRYENPSLLAEAPK